MRLFTGSPGFYDVAIFICDGQFGSFDLIISGNIRFADLHFGHVIFHYLFLDLRSILYGLMMCGSLVDVHSSTTAPFSSVSCNLAPGSSSPVVRSVLESSTVVGSSSNTNS